MNAFTVTKIVNGRVHCLAGVPLPAEILRRHSGARLGHREAQCGRQHSGPPHAVCSKSLSKFTILFLFVSSLLRFVAIGVLCGTLFYMECKGLSVFVPAHLRSSNVHWNFRSGSSELIM